MFCYPQEQLQGVLSPDADGDLATTTVTSYGSEGGQDGHTRLSCLYPQCT